jgi:hypothetical protein
MKKPIWTHERLKFFGEHLEGGVSRADFTGLFEKRFGVALTRGMISGIISRNFHGRGFGAGPRVPVPRMPRLLPRRRRMPLVSLEPVPGSAPVPIGPVRDFPDDKGCRYIHGDPGAAWQCCGAKTLDGPYCPYHEKLTRSGVA